MKESIRTDLALEASEESGGIAGVEQSEQNECGIGITTLRIKTESAAKTLGRAVGTYITCEFHALTDDVTPSDKRVSVIARLIRTLIPKNGCVLAAGLGNRGITPDALGPKTAESILATRHISGETARAVGLDGLRSVCVIAPGVLGQTGIEVSELISGIIKSTPISCVICIDALASRRLNRLGSTVQISDAGISPGAGVGNRRAELNEKTLGVPVIAVGVPTVVDAATLAHDLAGNDKPLQSTKNMIVTPREIDLLIERSSKLIAMAINTALQPTLTTEEIFALV